MKKLIVVFLLINSAMLHAQDERFFRKLFSGDLKDKEVIDNRATPTFQVAGTFYSYDINKDGRIESLVSEKRDGQEWLNIHDYKGKIIYSAHFETLGLNSWLYKVSIRNISNNTRVFIFHFYEGSTEYLEFKGQSRLYFLSIDNRDIKSLSLYKGPIIFDETESFKKDYHLRSYKMDLVDFNGDGVNEISLKYHLNSWVYLYHYPGKWLEI
jgi:hypothetical protein